MSWLSLLRPWQFSPTVLVAIVAAGIVYARGSCLAKPGVARSLSFWAGLLLMYAALQTQVDYYAEREFFVHRAQHLVLHHLAPFLLALSGAGPVMSAGAPASLRNGIHRVFAWPAVRRLTRVITNPVVSGTLFVGLIWVWLIPGVHFFAMLDVRLYRLMNWSMALDGLLFWCLAIDLRPSPPARYSAPVRVFLQVAVIPPQIACGAILTFTSRNLYPLYDLCGRAFATLSAHDDQTIGALILWIPSSMMSLVGVLIGLWAWFRQAEATSDASTAPLAHARESSV